MDIYPEDLRRVPTPLAGLLHMPDLQKQLISLVAEDNNIKFVSVDPECSILRKKERHAYDSYVPGGILKANWFYKHQHVIPSVLCILVEWGDDTQWRAQENTLVQHLVSVKALARHRSTRILILLIQERKGIPGETNAEERMQSFRKRVDLDAKSMLIMPAFDLKANVRKFVSIASQMSEAYYKDAGKRTKKLREHAQRHRGRHALDIRHEMKIGFYAEIRGDVRTAVKYYRQAYEAVVDTPKTADHMDEVKTVADYCNFKVCRILLRAISLGVPTVTAHDVVLQFRRHMSVFRPVIGPPDLEHHHWAWIARQYRVFGELLESVPHLISTSTSRYQNPAFYYMAAAECCHERRNAAVVVCGGADMLKPSPAPAPSMIDDLTTDPHVKVLLGHMEEGQVYVGVPPAVERKAGDAEQAEATVDHSGLAIEMLTRAHEQYKRSASSRRMTLYIAAQIALGFFESGDYEMARKFYSRISRTYRKEGWSVLLTAVLENDMICAQKLGLWREYVSLALELLTDKMDNSYERRCAIQTELMASLGHHPLIEFVVNDDRALTSVVQCSVRFAQVSVTVKQTTSLIVSLSAAMPLDVEFSKLEVQCSDSSIHTISTPISLHPNTTREFAFDIVPQSIGHYSVVTIKLALGDSVVFVWNYDQPGRSRAFSTGGEDIVASIDRHHDSHQLLVSAPASNLECDMCFEGPGMVNEVVVGDVQLTSDMEINNGVMTTAIVVENEDEDEETAGVSLSDLELIEPSAPISLPKITPHITHHVKVALRSVAVGNIMVVVQIIYSTDEHDDCILVKRFPIHFVPALQMRIWHHAPDLQPLGQPQAAWVHTSSDDHHTQTTPPLLAAGQTHTSVIEVECRTPYPLSIHAMSLKASHGIRIVHPINMSHVTLQQNERASVACQLSVDPSNESVPLGSIELQVERATAECDVFSTTYTLPYVRCRRVGTRVTFDTPTEAHVGQAFRINVCVRNDGAHVSEMRAQVRESSDFLYSGFKLWKFAVAPHSSRLLSYHVVPLSCGEAVLPHVGISLAKEGAGLLLETTEPGKIMVLP